MKRRAKDEKGVETRGKVKRGGKKRRKERR